ncbi:MAG: ribonuclease J [Candidatus Pacebacteria bacterium]|nr:ribonuclease J [Candidatus Paceibacterota bacterium]
MTDTQDKKPRKRRTYNAGFTPHKNNNGNSVKTRGSNPRGKMVRSGTQMPRVNRSRPIKQKPQALVSAPTHKERGHSIVPPLGEGNIRVMPLGGVEEIGRNMTAIEYNNEIIVVDAGFQFESAETPGVDYILANTGYLRDNKHKIKAVAITHGHLDHIGGLPYLMAEIGDVPVFSAILVTHMIKARQDEFPHSQPLDLRVVEGSEKIKVGESISLEFFETTHTFPDSIGVIIKTPIGDVAITGDIKLDHVDEVPTKEEFNSFARFKNNPPLMLLMDSTNVWKQGWSIPEHTVFKTFEKLILNHKSGRLIIGAFSSQMERLAKIISIAEQNGKKVVLEGRSMKQNMTIAEKVGFFKPQKGTLIDVKQIVEYPPSRIIILATGAQGDEFAALNRIAKKEHKHITLKKEDTIVLSSSVIPGNERAVQSLKDKFARQNAHLITIDTSDVHASGHGYAEEAKWIHKQINPKFFMPQHGHYFMLRTHADTIHESIGLPYENIAIPQGNSAVIEIQKNGTKLVQLKERVASVTRVVEGHKITDIQTTVMRDRKELSEEGIFMIVATIDQKTGRLRKSPDIISRGFIYLRESQDLLQQSRLIVKKVVERVTRGQRQIDTDRIKAEIATDIQKYLMQQTHKRPIVIPVVVTV